MTDATHTTERAAERNVRWHAGEITRAERERAHGHRSAVLWLTGLSASGKSTLARAIEVELFSRGVAAYVLDGDNVRHGLNRDLGFSPEARTENIRRVAEVAKLFTDFGALVISALISPLDRDRAEARAVLGADYIEVFVRCDLAVCESRDPKGLYRRARRGEVREFTGVTAPYEEPDAPDLVVETAHESPAESAARVIELLEARRIVPAGGRASRVASTRES